MKTKDCKIGNHDTIQITMPYKIVCKDCNQQWTEDEWTKRHDWDLKVQEYLQENMEEAAATGN